MFAASTFVLLLLISFHEVVGMPQKDPVSNILVSSASAFKADGGVEEGKISLREPVSGGSPNEILADDITELILRTGPVRETITNMLTEAKETVDKLRSKAVCIQKRAMAAGEEATQGIFKTGSCSLKSAQTAGTSISNVIHEIENHIFSLGKTFATFAVDIVKCRSAFDRKACGNRVIRDAEIAVARASCGIKNAIDQAGQTWKSLYKDLKVCFVGGAQEVTAVEFEFRKQILDCIAN